MIIPVTISLLISTIFLNFGFLAKGAFLMPNHGEPVKIGKVSGISEYHDETKISLDQPISQVPNNQAKKPEHTIADYDFPAQNGVILDYDGSLFFAKSPDRAWPIASITKLFTAYLFLEYNPGWETSYEISSADKREGGKIYLFTGDKVKVKDLFVI